MVLEVLAGRTTIVPSGDNMTQVTNLPYIMQPVPAASSGPQKMASIATSSWQATIMRLGMKTFCAPREII